MKITPPPYIAALEAYKPGKPIADVMAEYGLSDVIKLASNENPLGASPKALAAATQSLRDLHHYPNGGKTLREAIARKYRLSMENVIAGSGSEGVMNTLMRTFLQTGDEVITSAGTFTGFYVLAHAMGLKLVTVPMKDYAYDLDGIANRISEDTKLVYLANPNNPTGSVFGRAAFEHFYRRVPKDVLILHDEAYYDFALPDTPDYFTLLDDLRPNVLTLRTFSKSHGLAGIRIGFGTGPTEIIEPMLKVKLPFEPSSTAQAAGVAALGDDEFLARTIETNQTGKQYLKKAFAALAVSYVDTAANFFLLPFASPSAAHEFVYEMERRGIIVRPVDGSGLPDCVRVSIGTMEENERAMRAMKEIYASITEPNLSFRAEQ
ncbi:MAG TPA: histidinol-phosphate transaminase [Candidatus Kapabacteria bacterium]|nr:histidinol-phosphate transaminase [Candidatus Kapabacteria bacterium]